jgi:hypothetical protein
MTARTNNGKDNNARATTQGQTTAKAKYRDLSTARRTMKPSAASVEMTCSWGRGGRFVGGLGKATNSDSRRIRGKQKGRAERDPFVCCGDGYGGAEDGYGGAD